MAAPEPVTAHLQPFVRTLWLSLWAIAVLGFLALFYLGLVLASFVLVVISSGLIFASAYYLIQTWYEFRTLENVVHVTAEGYHDVRLGDLVPWSEIKSLKRHAPGTRVYLMIETDKPERFLNPRGRLRRAADAANRRRGFPPLTSDLSGLDLPGDIIVDAAMAFHAARNSAATAH